LIRFPALAQGSGSRRPKPTAPPVNEPPSTTGSGLPGDWKFELPKNEGALFTGLGGRKGEDGKLILTGVSVETEGARIRFGEIRPQGRAVSLTSEMRKVVGTPGGRLKLDILNQSYCPFKTNPHDAANKPLVGPLKKPDQIFEGKAFIPVREVIKSALEQAGQAGDAVKPLLEALSEQVVLVTPAHQFLIDNTVGNRIVAYSSKGEGIQHAHVDQLVHELAKQNMRVVKLMTYFKYHKDLDDESAATNGQGGTVKEIVSDGVGGSWHAGGFSAGFDGWGRLTSTKSDWPSDYGRLLEARYIEYNAHLFAIDYQGGVRRPIPSATLAAYYRNADMWDIAAALVVPFVDKDPDPIYTTYQYNPLELYDRRSARRVAVNLAKLSTEEFLKHHGAFYCSEAQYTVANLGPQDYALLKRSSYGSTGFGRLIDAFQSAPGYQGKSAEARRKLPMIGWNHLKQLGPQKGGISEEQFELLGETDRTATVLEWLPEEVRGWQAYSPREKEGLIARPMTVATVAWSLLRRYLPREGVARVIADDIMRAFQTGSPAVKQAVSAMCGGASPETQQGQIALAHVVIRAATGMLIGILASKEVREGLLAKGGYREVLASWDKGKVERAYDEFLNILRTADYSSQESLDRALFAADERLSRLTVWRRYYSKSLKKQLPWRRQLMKFAAPTCFVAWAQQPFLARTGCIRYVATAMHTRQAKTSG
jgi:hypothetical protein